MYTLLGAALLLAGALGAAIAVTWIRRWRREPFSAFAADSILHGMTESLLVLDGHGAIRLANRAAGELFSAPVTALIGRPIDALLDQPVGPHAKPIRQLLSTVPAEHEVTVRRSPTDVRTLSLLLSPIRRDGRASDAIACFFRDITERKRSEKRLHYTNQLLLQHQRELFDTLVSAKKANEELKSTQLQLMQAAKLESIGRLAAGVAHEVKNPLAIILMGVEYLAHALNGNGHSVAPVLNDISEAVRRADGVIKGMLDFSAPKELQLQQADLNHIITQSVELVRHALTQRHIAVVTELAESLLPLPLDPNKMKQVFVNLFMNAIDAMADGGTLTIRSDVMQLTGVGDGVGRRETDRFRLGDTAVVVEIADTGCGIPDSHLSKLFEPFFTTKPAGQGTGLGLAVTKTILELHGGLIDIRNRPEGGAMIRLRFKAESADG